MDAGENECGRGWILGEMTTEEHRCQRGPNAGEKEYWIQGFFAVDAEGGGRRWLYLDGRFNVGSRVGVGIRGSEQARREMESDRLWGR